MWMDMKRGLECGQALTEKWERCGGQREKPGRQGEERGAQFQGLLLTLLSNSRKTSFEIRASGSHHAQYLSAQHIQPWEKRSCLWYVLPVLHVVVT